MQAAAAGCRGKCPRRGGDGRSRAADPHAGHHTQPRRLKYQYGTAADSAISASANG